MRRQRLLFLALAGLAVLGCGCKDAVPADAPAEMPACQYYVALTFDDGPRNGTTDRLLDGLRERGAGATFFLLGELIEYDDTEKLFSFPEDKRTEDYITGRFG